jgi:hypothetical protein
MDTDLPEQRWRKLAAQLPTAAERLVLYGSFVLNMPPRTLCHYCPEHFPDVQAVYTLKRQVLMRLEHGTAN